MAGILDGLFGGAGTGILPDWLWQNPQPRAEMPNAMDGGSPAGNFEDRWSGVAAMPAMQSVADMFRGGANPTTSVPLPRPRPDITPGDEGGGPLPPAAPQPAAPPPGNPFAGGGDVMSRIGDWINDNRNMLALFGAGIAGGGGTGSWNAGMSDALRGMVTGGRIDSEQRQQQAAQQYIGNATGIEPNLKAAMLANPALAAQYLSARARRPDYKLARTATSTPVPPGGPGYNWAERS